MGRKIAGWVVSGLVGAFMLLDAGLKFAQPAGVAEAFQRTGWPMDLAVTLGVILLGCTVLYLIPKTAVLGSILLTAYLGGAVATNLRLHNPAFNTWFPVVFGILAWVGLWLRERRVGEVFPLC
jgi:hypothetical protein